MHWHDTTRVGHTQPPAHDYKPQRISLVAAAAMDAPFEQEAVTSHKAEPHKPGLSVNAFASTAAGAFTLAVVTARLCCCRRQCHCVALLLLSLLLLPPLPPVAGTSHSAAAAAATAVCMHREDGSWHRYQYGDADGVHGVWCGCS